MDRKVLEALGIGFSHLLRYSYGGFLLMVFASVMRPDTVTVAVGAMGWQLAALTAVVVGAATYAVHRSIVVPVHHGVLCLLWWLVDATTHTQKAASASPTSRLASIGVPLRWRIPAYTVLRRSDVFEKEKSNWDVAHAEAGLVLMTAEAFMVAAIYARTQTEPPVDWRFLLWPSVVFFIFSFAGFVQHAVESMRFRQNESEVKDRLRAAGMIDP